MQELWIVLLVAAALLVLFRVRARRRRPASRPASQPLRISGYQINAGLHPRMSTACLFDHGLQYGKGFRRKEGPELPHRDDCRCETVPFSFTSSEVFNGALRGLAHVDPGDTDLSPEGATMLLERLKSLEGQPVPADPEAYVAQVDLSSLPAAEREPARAFLAERHAWLTGAGKAAPGPTTDGVQEA